MSDSTALNTQVNNTVKMMQGANLNSEFIKLSGAGKAYQSVSQSSAITVQDAADNLRNVTTMATTAMGVALSQMLATGNAGEFTEVIKQANQMVADTADNYATIGKNAATVLKEFPVGE